MSAANRKRRIGQVISDKMDKTVVVAVQWRQRHPVYRKSIRRISKFHAHDEQNDARIGDRVLIVETKPLSRLKRWRIAEILERHEVPEIAPQEIGAAIEEEIAQPEAAVAVADGPQAEEVGTAEPEAAEGTGNLNNRRRLRNLNRKWLRNPNRNRLRSLDLNRDPPQKRQLRETLLKPWSPPRMKRRPRMLRPPGKSLRFLRKRRLDGQLKREKARKDRDTDLLQTYSSR